MSGSDRSFDRRSVLKGLGVGGLAVAGGTGALAFGTGSARAQAALDVQIDKTSYSGDQGVVDQVGVIATKVLKWENYDVPIRAFDITHKITLRNGTIDGSTDWHTLYDGTTGWLKDWSAKGDYQGWGGDGEYVARTSGDKGENLNGKVVMDIDWAVISDTNPSVQNPVDWTDELSVSEDGTTRTRTVAWKTTITYLTDAYTEDDTLKPVKESDGEPQVQGSTEFDVTVTNEQGNIDGNTDGSSTAE